ncbi:MAG: hypothetical protein ABJB74_22285 [Gemmatimonas sp.]
MNAVADALTAVALKMDTANFASSMNAIFALRRTEHPSTGTPYANAADRLMVIAETADDLRDRGMASASIGQFSDHAVAVNLLTRIAQWKNPVALVAVQSLSSKLGPDGGLVALQRMWKNGSITNSMALDELRFVAVKNKWQH